MSPRGSQPCGDIVTRDVTHGHHERGPKSGVGVTGWPWEVTGRDPKCHGVAHSDELCQCPWLLLLLRTMLVMGEGRADAGAAPGAGDAGTG